jgi:hypothetical protein
MTQTSRTVAGKRIVEARKASNNAAQKRRQMEA